MTEGPDRQRRAARRVRTRIEVAYEDADRQVFLSTADLSEGGAFLLAPDPPAPGVTARVVFELPGHPVLLRLPVVVARREEAPRSGFAVRFQTPGLAEPTRRALRRYVERVSGTSPGSTE